ncbi:MAG: RNA 2',3'-cyclic phosphodiesterase [Actinomycetota bacterium]
MARDRSRRPGAEALRLFVAVDLPPRAMEAVEEAIGPWRERFSTGRWVRPENRHVTMKFLGRTYPRLVAAVEEACRDAAKATSPITVGLTGMGVFPGPTRARVLWVGLDDPDRLLTALAENLQQRLPEEFPPEKRAFTAHLTVARFNPPVPAREHVEDLASTVPDAPPFTVDHLVLYRSHLSPKGVRYEPLQTFPFGG